MQRTQSVADALNRMGMPLYGAQPPTGYSMRAESWVNSGALLSRMNFALGLGTGKLPGVRMDATKLAGTSTDAEDALRTLEQTLVAGERFGADAPDDCRADERSVDDGTKLD